MLNSVYFGGLKLFDRDLNPIPPGTYSATGEGGIDYMLSNIPVVITVMEAERIQDTFTLVFSGPPGEVNWSIKASTDLKSFPLDLTSSSIITETEPGTYQAVVDVSGQSETLFLRVELGLGKWAAHPGSHMV